MRGSPKSRRGNTVLEFTLVGIPLMFVLIGIFEISRGMWVYHTLAYAIKQGTRYAVVHSENCSVSPNSCSVTIGTVAALIRDAAVGMPPAGAKTSQLQLTFCAPPGSAAPTCVPGAAQTSSCSGINPCTCYLQDCLGIPTTWPPTGANRVGLDDLEIVGIYPFTSAIALVWPGAHSVNNFPTFNLPASARERVQF
jgi:hypothetical protein